MTGVCKLCGQLVQGAPSVELDPDARRIEEFNNLSAAARQHVFLYHQAHCQTYGQVIQAAVLWMSTLMVQSVDPDFAACQELQKQALFRIIDELQPVRSTEAAPAEAVPC